MEINVATGIRISAYLATFAWLAGCAHLPVSTPGERVETQHYRVSGLSKPAEILVDEWGVPHIYANEHYDAFFVQGFNAARDRLWQIDLWRRRGLGKLSEVLGSAYVEQDRAARLFLYRGDMFREWLAYGSDAKRIAEAFTNGINAYVELIEAGLVELPFEFEVLDYAPSRWSPADVVRIRSHGLWRNLRNEVARARAVCEFGLDLDAARFILQPDWKTTVPQGLDPCSVPGDVARVYELATAPVDFTKAVQFAASQASSAGLKPPVPAAGEGGEGSNNWVVAPHRTATGRPILASDPHRAHSVPSLRYIAHLVAPGLNVIGAGEPSLPGISIGHNGTIAFGLTIFAIDQEDLVVHRVDGERYRHRGTWREFTKIVETVDIRDQPPREIEMLFSVDGPVIHSGPAHAFAARVASLEPGMAPYFGSIEYMRASNWDEFLAALNRWGAPAENQIFADVEGNIGYKSAGLTPIRENYDGLMPVPGDGHFRWRGFHDMDRLPVALNPARGWLGTANEMNLPDEFPHEQVMVGFEWAPSWRMDRVTEVLEETAIHRLADSIALQNDYLSVPARLVLNSLTIERLPPQAARLFRAWDFRLEPDSAAALLFEYWFSRFLTESVMKAALNVEDLGTIQLSINSNETVTHFLAMPQERRQAMADTTLRQAIAALSDERGPGPDNWRWGDFHQLRLKHPLYDFVDDELRQKLKIAAVRMGGSADTANNTRYRSTFDVYGGASWRMVLDVGAWDNAVMTNSPGQSGDPSSRHYSDLLELWARGDTVPLLYSRERIERAAHSVIRLTPITGGNGRNPGGAR